jgi:hypothetical protein
MATFELSDGDLSNVMPVGQELIEVETEFFGDSLNSSWRQSVVVRG